MIHTRQTAPTQFVEANGMFLASPLQCDGPNLQSSERLPFPSIVSAKG